MILLKTTILINNENKIMKLKSLLEGYAWERKSDGSCQHLQMQLQSMHLI